MIALQEKIDCKSKSLCELLLIDYNWQNKAFNWNKIQLISIITAFPSILQWIFSDNQILVFLMWSRFIFVYFQFNRTVDVLILTIANFDKMPFIFINLVGQKPLFQLQNNQLASSTQKMRNYDPKRNSLYSYFTLKQTPNTQSQPNKHTIINQNTNCSHPTNHDNDSQIDPNSIQLPPPFFQQQQFQKQTLIHEEASQNSNQSSNMITLQRPPKFAFNFTDDELTKNPRNKIKEVIKQQADKQVNAKKESESKKSMNHCKKPTPSQSHICNDQIEIVPDKKVEEILNKPPLRLRYSQLLKGDQKLTIGVAHTKLLSMMRTMDNTIQFFTTNRKIKNVFFQNLVNNIYKNTTMIIELHNLQQLLFVDDELYKVRWELNPNIMKQALVISTPKIQSQDQRIKNTRKKIIVYLQALELEFMNKNNKVKNSNNWVEGFDVNSIDIPTKDLPTHPYAAAKISEVDKQEIKEVKNENLRKMMLNMKEESESKTLRSADVAKMIFSGQSSFSIREKIYAAVSQKETRKKYQVKQNKIDNKSLITTCDEVLLIYMGKGVTNIFKVTLLELLYKKLKYDTSDITKYVEMMVNCPQICFLKEVLTSNKTVVLQIDKSKFNEQIEYFKKMK